MLLHLFLNFHLGLHNIQTKETTTTKTNTRRKKQRNTREVIKKGMESCKEKS
jgi:hypothetical protein